jgi:hypothetical protein
MIGAVFVRTAAMDLTGPLTAHAASAFISSIISGGATNIAMEFFMKLSLSLQPAVLFTKIFHINCVLSHHQAQNILLYSIYSGQTTLWSRIFAVLCSPLHRRGTNRDQGLEPKALSVYKVNEQDRGIVKTGKA